MLKKIFLYIMITRLELYNDWIELLKAELNAIGFNLQGISDEDIPNAFFSLKMRVPERKARTIHYSSQFVCPTDLQPNLLLLEEKIRTGESLRPYLSRFTQELFKKDALLFDWGVHHLHLGTNIVNGYCNRTSELLFVRFLDDDAYFINIFDHRSWEEKSIVDIIELNWQNTIDNYRLPNAHLVHNLTQEELKKARGVGVTTPIQTASGNVYSRIGGGYSSSKDSTLTRKKHQICLKSLNHLEEHFKSNINAIAGGCFKNNSPLHFELKKYQNEYIIWEKNNNFHITFSDLLIHNVYAYSIFQETINLDF